MSGRRKGSKYLGKERAKRHGKVLRDNIQYIIKPAIFGLTNRDGVERIFKLVYKPSVRKYELVHKLWCASSLH